MVQDHQTHAVCVRRWWLRSCAGMQYNALFYQGNCYIDESSREDHSRLWHIGRGKPFVELEGNTSQTQQKCRASGSLTH